MGNEVTEMSIMFRNGGAIIRDLFKTKQYKANS
jgi:hypothetical protein